MKTKKALRSLRPAAVAVLIGTSSWLSGCTVNPGGSGGFDAGGDSEVLVDSGEDTGNDADGLAPGDASVGPDADATLNGDAANGEAEAMSDAAQAEAAPSSFDATTSGDASSDGPGADGADGADGGGSACSSIGAACCGVSCRAGLRCGAGGCEVPQSVAVGFETACAVLPQGTVECWGESDSAGALGTGDAGSVCGGIGNCTLVPTLVPSLSGVVEIAASQEQLAICALLTSGTVECWGEGSGGSAYAEPVPVPVSNLSDVVAISAGLSDFCGVLSDGSVSCWEPPNTRCDGGMTCAPTAVPVSGVSGAIAVAVSFSGACARLTDGTVECWGDNRFGQLGNGTTVSSSAPVPVLNVSNAIAIAAGAESACAAIADGTVRCWGSGGNGTLGNGSLVDASTPVTVSGLTGVTAISMGGYTACALRRDGTVSCWGKDDAGQIGVGGSTLQSCLLSSPCSPTPVDVPNLSFPVANLPAATSIAVGGQSACSLLADGVVECWGDGHFGALGNGGTESSSTPVVAVGGINCGGVTTDPNADPANCGSCGNNCGQAPCQAGTCGLAPTVLAAGGAGNPGCLALSSTDVYWTDGISSSVLEAPLNGGAAATFSPPNTQAGALALDASYVYWAAGSSVVRAPLAGGPPSTVMTGDAASAIAIGGTNLYWSSQSTGQIRTMPLGGGAVSTLTTGLNLVVALAVDTTSLYWADRETVGPGTVGRVALVDGTRTNLASGGDDATSLAIDPANIYWTGYDGRVRTLPLGGGPESVLARGPLPIPTGAASVAVDSTHAYWLAGTSVMRADLAGGSPPTLVAIGQDATCIALDGSNIYWTANLNQTSPVRSAVMKLSK